MAKKYYVVTFIDGTESEPILAAKIEIHDGVLTFWTKKKAKIRTISGSYSEVDVADYHYRDVVYKKPIRFGVGSWKTYRKIPND